MIYNIGPITDKIADTAKWFRSEYPGESGRQVQALLPDWLRPVLLDEFCAQRQIPAYSREQYAELAETLLECWFRDERITPVFLPSVRTPGQVQIFITEEGAGWASPPDGRRATSAGQ